MKTGENVERRTELDILVACEESQAVTKELRRLGHKAFSCDIIECSGGHPEWHIMQDVLPLLNGDCEYKTMDGITHHIDGKWDMIIAFPPCTDLASSGARWFPQKWADGKQQRAIAFFMRFVEHDTRWVVENPVGIMSTAYRKPDQIIQPWQFGHGETKATCIWHSTDLRDLVPTEIVSGREQRVWKMPPSKDRAMMRARTYPGIARAMAEQWAGQCKEAR